MPASLDDFISLNRGGTPGDGSTGTYLVDTLRDAMNAVDPLVVHFGGEFLLDPNEFTGWGVRGIGDDRHTQDLGDVGAAMNRNAGGFHYPYDVRLKRLSVWHRNSNADAQAWGWRITTQAKTANSNAVVNSDLLREVTGTGAAGVAPRDYGNSLNQNTDLDLTGLGVIPAGTVITLGVEAPTAVGTNRYVQVESGYLELERA